MRLLICAGMTGGGIYPALAVHQALVDKTEAALWVGSENGLEESLLAPFNISFRSIPGGGIHGMGAAQLVRNTIELTRGYQKAKQIIKDFSPDVIFYTGGYIGVPMAFAARRTPSVVFVPDIEPGLALKTIIKKAEIICVSTDLSTEYINHSKNMIVTGYPLREEIKEWNRESGRGHFGIGKSEKIILIFGGSKGARSINDALIPNINALTKDSHIIHITGVANWEACQSMIDQESLNEPERYHPYPFMHSEMGAALASADLVVCRAGASTIGELPYFGLPAILVPYPHAWRYQRQNADYLTGAKAAVLLRDSQLQDQLLPTINQLILDEKKLDAMKMNMKNIAVDGAAARIADVIDGVAQGSKGEKSL